MSVEISVMHSMESTVIVGDFSEFISNLNIAAASGKQFVICTEQLPNGETTTVAFDTRNITRIREIQKSDAFIGS